MEPMETRTVLLRGIARVLNAGGSALVDMYDAATSIKAGLVPGEQGKLKTLIREYEKKVERLYYEIGKEVALGENSAQVSAVAEAGIKLVAEYRVKIERMEQSLRAIADKDKAAAKSATGRAEAKAESAADAGETNAVEAPVAGEVSADVPVEEEKESVAEAVETQAPEVHAGAPESAEPEAVEALSVAATEEIKEITAEAEAPVQKPEEEKDQAGESVTSESSLGVETKQEEAHEALEEMLKSDLLKLCMDKGIDVDQRMTKTAIIELIKKGRI